LIALQVVLSNKKKMQFYVHIVQYRVNMAKMSM